MNFAHTKNIIRLLGALSLACVTMTTTPVIAAPAQAPLFLGGGQPLVLLNMSRDHKLYYEAYNDSSDINGDGTLDIGFKENIKYFGYFDSNKCYDWDAGNGRFSPAAVTAPDTTKCTGSTAEWSGNFLNYVTTSRMDAMRKVLYGGKRSTEDATTTVLERSYIPQDAHAWGKEYESIARDGYNITEYTPLSLPVAGTRHLFANTTLRNNEAAGPLMRVLTDSKYRIWEWVSIEGPVAGVNCLHGKLPNDGTGVPCEVAAATSSFVTVPASATEGLSGMTQATYKTGAIAGGSPTSQADFDAMETTYKQTANLCGSKSVSTINGSGNPFDGINGCTGDNYMTLFAGTLNIATAGTYEFSVDGDDAVDLFIDGNPVANYYSPHGSCNCDTHTGSITLTAGIHTISFRHHERDGGDQYYLRWKRTVTASVMTDYKVRVEVCKTGLLESDCKGYPIGAGTPTVYRPTGLLHEFGDSHTMAFGLLTGSYTNNMQGGVLRKNIENFANEVDATTGIYTSVIGIVKTLDKLTVTDFSTGYTYGNWPAGWKVDGPMTNSTFAMWGNPVAEMMYEGLRYLAGKSAPTTEFASGTSNEKGLGLPTPAWQNPYRNSAGGYGWCSKPFQMVISDINPSFDSDQVPGTAFGSFTGDLSSPTTSLVNGVSTTVENWLDVSTLGKTIWNNETEATNIFIGHSLANTPDYDGAPSAKTVNSFGNIRGLSPEEPTKQGSYYAASVAYYGNKHKITSPEYLPSNGTKQNVQTFAVALASPLPRIEIPVSTSKTVTFVPFAKSVGGLSISATPGNFQPTNQIVDFYIDKIRNVTGFPTDATVNSGRPYYKFLINFEDVEQGADHDMDAIAEYTISLNADNTIQVKVESTYASGSIIQHVGYVVSGSTADGTYLVVRDKDTAAGDDPDYFLDKPYEYPAANIALPLINTRTFTAGANPSAAFLKHDPLWYAAKWGGFTDLTTSKDDLPNQAAEWDKKAADGSIGQDQNPDNYFLVTNAGKLKDQLRSAFAEISERVTSASAVAQNSTRLDTDSMIFQARFNTQDWTGQLRALKINTGNGAVDVATPVWEASEKIPAHTVRKIYTWDPVLYAGNKFEVTASVGLTTGQLTSLNLGGATTTAEQEKIVNYLRGDSANEQKNGGTLRNRSSRLGDIINTDPIYVYVEDFGYEALAESQPAIAGDPNLYAIYRDDVKPDRRKMIYVSSNDGIVHGIDGSDNASTGGVEQFGFVPNAALAKMKGLAQPSYSHEYIVDGSLFAGDAHINGAWKTVLLGSTGAALNKSIFALDITNPDAFDASKVMWEFTHTELGYPLGQSVIARMPNGRWAAVFGNGVESASGRAKLFIVYLDPALGSGSPGWTADTDYCILETDSTIANNGLSSPALLDTNGDGIIDNIYAGDIQGNLWKFKLDATGQGSTDNCPTGKWQKEKRVFQTQDTACKTRNATGVVSNCTSPTTKRQPINSQIEISANQTGQTSGNMLFFGTGSYYQNSDVNDMTKQSFYAIWDDGGNSTVALTDLVKQTIDSQGTITVDDAANTGSTLSYDYRVTSSNPVAYPAMKGWYLDLLTPNPTAAAPLYQGERIVSSPLLRAGRVVFTTLIPSTDSCSFGGDSWIMEVELASGKSTATPVFDLNNDGGFSNADKSGANVVSGIKSPEGIIKTPAIISAGGTEYKISSGTTGNIVKITEKGTVAVKRTSWRQYQ